MNGQSRDWWGGERAVLGIVSLALFTDLVLYDMVVPILPALVDRVGRGPEDVGLLFAVYALGYLCFTPLFGTWSDRTADRKVPMLVGQAGLAVSTVLFVRAGCFGGLILARLLQGVGAACSWTLGLALVADTFPPERVGTAMGFVMGFNTLGYFMGPLLGGSLTQLVSLDCPFYVCAGLVVVDFVGRCLLRRQPRIEDCNSTGGIDEKVISYWDLLGYPEVLVLSAITIVQTGSVSAVETLLAHHLGDTFDLSILGISITMMAIIVPSILASLLVGNWSDRHCRYTTITLGLLTYLPATVLMGLAGSLGWFVVASGYFGATAAIVSTPVLPEMAAIVHRLGASSFARVYALHNICYSLGMLTGPLIAVWAYGRCGGFLGAMCVMAVLCTLLLLPPTLWLSLRARQGVLPSYQPIQQRRRANRHHQSRLQSDHK